MKKIKETLIICKCGKRYKTLDGFNYHYYTLKWWYEQSKHGKIEIN